MKVSAQLVGQEAVSTVSSILPMYLSLQFEQHVQPRSQVASTIVRGSAAGMISKGQCHDLHVHGKNQLSRLLKRSVVLVLDSRNAQNAGSTLP